MKKFLAFACSLLLLTSAVFCQEESEEDDDIRFSGEFTMNEPGDQYIAIGLMATAPLNFGGSFPLYRDGQMSLGGAGSLGYHRFVTSWLAFGLDVSFGYNPTIGENIFTYVPFILNVTVQPSYKRFEFPVTVGAGAAVESYLSRTYFPGLVIKGQGGAFYRASPSWSFGINGDFMYMPQWYSDSDKNDYGIFGSFMISARYHF